MLTIKNILLVTLATFTVGCVGELEPMPADPTDPEPTDPEPETNAAKVIYDDNVAPMMTSKCGSCHTKGMENGDIVGFVDSPAKAYDTMTRNMSLVGNFAASVAPVLTRITPGQHYGATYGSNDIAKITEWLDKEVEIRFPETTNPTNPTPPQQETPSQITRRLYKEWSGCMTRADFDAANMAQGVGGWEAQNNQECDNCHATAGEGFMASRDGAFFFKVITERSAYLAQYFVVDLSTGVAGAKIIQNRASIESVSQRQAPHTEHPTFDAINGQGTQAITAFYNATAAKAANPATCEVPAGRLID